MFEKHNLVSTSFDKGTESLIYGYEKRVLYYFLLPQDWKKDCIVIGELKLDKFKNRLNKWDSTTRPCLNSLMRGNFSFPFFQNAKQNYFLHWLSSVRISSAVQNGSALMK